MKAKANSNFFYTTAIGMMEHTRFQYGGSVYADAGSQPGYPAPNKKIEIASVFKDKEQLVVMGHPILFDKYREGVQGIKRTFESQYPDLKSKNILYIYPVEVQSKKGEGHFMFVTEQKDGRIYASDLSDPSGKHVKAIKEMYGYPIDRDPEKPVKCAGNKSYHLTLAAIGQLLSLSKKFDNHPALVNSNIMDRKIGQAVLEKRNPNPLDIEDWFLIPQKKEKAASAGVLSYAYNPVKGMREETALQVVSRAFLRHSI